MKEQKRKEVQYKMSPQLAAKSEYLMQLLGFQSEGFAKTLTELTDTMDACGYDSDTTPMRQLAKSIMSISQSLMIGGGK